MNNERQQFESTVERLVDESGFEEWTLAELWKLHRAAYEAGAIAMREKAKGLCNAYAELLRPEDRGAVRLIGAQIGGLAISGAEESKKEK